MYDPAIGRWHAVDPLAEKYAESSSFGYVRNNPIIKIDPDGRDEWTVNIKSGERNNISNIGGNEEQIIHKISLHESGATELHGTEVITGSTERLEQTTLSDGWVVTNYSSDLSDIYNSNTDYEYTIADFYMREAFRKGKSNPIRTYILSSESRGLAVPLTKESEQDFYGSNFGLLSWCIFLDIGLGISEPSPTKIGVRGGSLSKNSLSIQKNRRKSTSPTNSYREFLKVNKGTYKGKNWQRQATKDYYNSSYYKGK